MFNYHQKFYTIISFSSSSHENKINMLDSQQKKELKMLNSVSAEVTVSY